MTLDLKGLNPIVANGVHFDGQWVMIYYNFRRVSIKKNCTIRRIIFERKFVLCTLKIYLYFATNAEFLRKLNPKKN